MTINVNDNSFKNRLNAADANTLADMLRGMEFGNFVRSMPTTARNVNMTTQAANPYVLATLQAITLPDDGKASNIFRAYARTATAGAGELTVAAFGTTPTTGQIAVAPNGDIVTLAADAITNLDLVYLPERYDVVEYTGPVSSNSLAIPSAITASGVVLLLEAEALTGTSAGKKIVLTPSASAAAAGQARLVVAKTSVTFNATDAITSARVKLAIGSLPDMNSLLTAVGNYV
jgi:hypothetical protein